MKKFNLHMFDRKPGVIESMLRCGSNNGVTMAELAAAIGCDARAIRAQVHKERTEGAVILAGDTGFYLPSDDPETAIGEIRAFERRMKSKARNTLKATQSATAARIRLECCQRLNRE